MSKRESGSGFHRQREFQRKNSPFAPSGPEQTRRPSLQRRILTSGATKTVIQEEPEESPDSSVEKAVAELATQTETTDSQKINVLRALPASAREKIPSALFRLFEWPHPSSLWGLLLQQSEGLRAASGAFFKATGRHVAVSLRRMGEAFSTMTYKAFESGSAKATKLREQMPAIHELKRKIPGSEQFGQFMDTTRVKLSKSLDRKVRKKALDALLARDTLLAERLDLEQSSIEFFDTFLEKADVQVLVKSNADFVPVSMQQNKPGDIPELLAYKQLIPQRYPELVQRGLDLQLRTLGYLLTSHFAQQRGKCMDRSSVDFANFVAMSLEDPEEVAKLIEDVRLKWKLFNEDITNRLTQAALHSLGQGLIAKDTFQAVNVSIRSFLRLPPG